MRLKLILVLLILTPIGFYSKAYTGPMAYWVNNSFSGVLYEIFWCLAILFIAPRIKPASIASCVFLITCLLEILQLWHPPLLQTVRATFIGQTLIGTSFVWTDFIYYAAGCGLGYLLIEFIREETKPHP